MGNRKIATAIYMIVVGLLFTTIGFAQTGSELGTDITLLSLMDDATAGSRTFYYEDVSGNGYHVKNQAVPAYDGGGARSTAVDFTNTTIANTNVMTVFNGDSTELLPGTKDYSISMWYYENPFVVDEDTSNDFRYIMDFGNYTNSFSPGFSFNTYQGRTHIRTQDINAESSTRCQPILPVGADLSGQWNHVVITCDRSGVNGTPNLLDFYVNGVLQSAQNLNPSTSGDPNNILAQASEQLYIGGKPAFNQQFDGYLDDIAFYEGVLTYTDVQTLYTANGLDANTVTNPNVTPVMLHNFENNLESVPTVYGSVKDDAYGTYPGTVYEGEVINDAVRGEVLSFQDPANIAGVRYGDFLDPGNSDYTVSLWFKNDGTGSGQCIASKGNASSPDDGWNMYLVGDKLYVRANYGDNEARVGVNHTFTENEWHHLVMVIDNENGIFKSYIDGQGSGTSGTDNDWTIGGGSGETTVEFTPGVSFDCDNDLILGNHYRFMPFQGELDDFAIWNRALTDAEILAITNGQTIVISEERLPGDANGDGKVDGSDVTILAGNWQAGVGSPDPVNINWSMGDFNGDGQIDGSDVTILAGNWQAGVATAAASVPEPSTLALLLTIASLVMILRRK